MPYYGGPSDGDREPSIFVLVSAVSQIKFSHSLGAGGFSAPVLSSCRYWVNRATVLGEQCGQWAQSALDARGPESLRSTMVLCGLIRKHSGAVLNAACAKALKSGTHRLKDVRRLIGEQSDVPAAGAILDRLLHHAEIIPITGRSYRLQPTKNNRNS
jgi:hypothetical protein